MNRSILLVDDDPAFRHAVSRALGSAGYRVSLAGDGDQAIARLQVGDIDLLITDIIMPDRDGVELIGAVRSSRPDVRILAISGRGAMGSVDLLKLAGMLGADDTLAKPFTTEELLARIEALLPAPST